jgi:hypothetical protein
MPTIETIQRSLVDVQTIIESDLPPIDWLVEGLLAQGDRVLFYGEPGSLKSWLMLDLGLHIATGRSWLGQYQVPHPKNVLYIDEEMSPRTLCRRIKRLVEGTDLGTDAIPFRTLSLCGLRFTQDDVATSLLHDVASLGFSPEVVIIETMRRVLDGSENNADEIAALWRRVGPFRQEGRTLIITHHMRKPSFRGINDPIYRASGSTDVLGGSDSAFAVEKLERSIASIECVRARNAEEPPPFKVILRDTDPDSPASMHFGGQVEATTPPQNAVNQVATWIEDFLRDQPNQRARTATIMQHLQTEHDVSPSRCEKALRMLRANSRVHQRRRGVYHLMIQEEAA